MIRDPWPGHHHADKSEVGIVSKLFVRERIVTTLSCGAAASEAAGPERLSSSEVISGLDSDTENGDIIDTVIQKT